MTQRQEIIERLNGLEMEGGSHEMLSAICKAVLPHGDAWTLRRCADLRDRLVRLLGEAEQPKEQGEGEEEESKEGHAVEQLRRESVVTRLRMAQQGGYDGSTGFVRGNVYQLFGVGEKSYDSIYFLAGNIATEVEREIASAKSAAYDQGYAAGYDAGFASADNWCAQHEDAMAEHGWYRALNADKQPIKLGDEVYQVKGGWVYTVESITFYPDNTTVSFGCKHGYGCDSAHNVRHYHAPTVEDVLREMLDKWGEMPSNMTNEAIIAEYAAKLRLAGDAE